jgi:hypothetical protein
MHTNKQLSLDLVAKHTLDMLDNKTVLQLLAECRYFNLSSSMILKLR